MTTLYVDSRKRVDGDARASPSTSGRPSTCRRALSSPSSAAGRRRLPFHGSGAISLLAGRRAGHPEQRLPAHGRRRAWISNWPGHRPPTRFWSPASSMTRSSGSSRTPPTTHRAPRPTQQIFSFVYQAPYNELYLRCSTLATAADIKSPLGQDILAKLIIDQGVGHVVHGGPELLDLLHEPDSIVGDLPAHVTTGEDRGAHVVALVRPAQAPFRGRSVG